MILSISAKKQLNMIAKVNDPFKSIQVVFQKSVPQKVAAAFREKVSETKSELVFISREYDGSERYMLLYPCGVSVDFFPQHDSIIVLQ